MTEESKVEESEEKLEGVQRKRGRRIEKKSLEREKMEKGMRNAKEKKRKNI